MAVREGATSAGYDHGYGERCGNVNCARHGRLELKLVWRCLPVTLAQLYELSPLVDEVANCHPTSTWLISASRLCDRRRACGRHAAFAQAYQTSSQKSRQQDARGGLGAFGRGNLLARPKNMASRWKRRQRQRRVE